MLCLVECYSRILSRSGLRGWTFTEPGCFNVSCLKQGAALVRVMFRSLHTQIMPRLHFTKLKGRNYKQKKKEIRTTKKNQFGETNKQKKEKKLMLNNHFNC
eukprot:104032_1